jgi:ribonuclease T2
VRSLSIAFLVSLLAAVAAAHACAEDARAGDAFVLVLTWQPTFCSSHAGLGECKAATAPRLVLHGLWPDWDVDGDGKRDADDDFCVPASRRQAVIAADTASGMGSDWRVLPAVELSAASRSDLDLVMPGVAAGLERHEWLKHGTCSGLKPDDYFATAILLVREVERGQLAKLIIEHAGGSVARKALLGAFAADYGKDAARALTFDCIKSAEGTRLAEIRIRLQRAKLAEGLDAGSIAVPKEAEKGDCSASIVVPALAR